MFGSSSVKFFLVLLIILLGFEIWKTAWYAFFIVISACKTSVADLRNVDLSNRQELKLKSFYSGYKSEGVEARFPPLSWLRSTFIAVPSEEERRVLSLTAVGNQARCWTHSHNLWLLLQSNLCLQPPLISDNPFSVPDQFPSQITVFGISCKGPPLVHARDHF